MQHFATLYLFCNSFSLRQLHTRQIAAKRGKLTQIRGSFKYDTSAFRMPRQTGRQRCIANENHVKSVQIAKTEKAFAPFFTTIKSQSLLCYRQVGSKFLQIEIFRSH